MSDRPNINDQVDSILSTINVNEIFSERNVLNAIENRRRNNPCEKIDVWKLFKNVFTNVYPNHDNVHKNVIDQVQLKMWDSANNVQKDIYRTYCRAHNNEIRAIFPQMLFSGDQPEADDSSNAQELGEMIWDGTDVS